MHLSVEPDEFGEGGSDYRLSLRPDDALEPLSDQDAFSVGDGTHTLLSLLDACLVDCQRSYTLVARLADPNGPAIDAGADRRRATPPQIDPLRSLSI